MTGTGEPGPVLAAAATSVRCGPPEVADAADLARVLRGARGKWVRGIGYHESVAGVLDRHALDRMAADRPVRLQHRSGALWMLNTRAITELGLLHEHDDGQLWRADVLLRERLGEHEPPDLAAVGRRLGSCAVGTIAFTISRCEASPYRHRRLGRLLGRGGRAPVGRPAVRRLRGAAAPSSSKARQVLATASRTGAILTRD